MVKAEQLKTKAARDKFLVTLSEVKEKTEIEKKRRIKRATFDNEDDRYRKDRAALEQIRNSTPPSSVQLTVNDFDFGEDLGVGIPVIKAGKNVEKGFYLVLAVHTDVAKRNAFLKKVISSGKTDVDFFYGIYMSVWVNI